MVILGIETSCDETACALVEDGRKILSNVVYSQTVHKQYGGVVPELASRAHIKAIFPVLDKALEEAKISIDKIEGVAVTCGPGLVGSLLIGISVAKSIAYHSKIPMVGVNHLEGHIFANLLGMDSLMTPFLCLIVSGGHTELVLVSELGKYIVLGGTLDDACGEAFDKVAKLLGLSYPGGPQIEQEAKSGNHNFVRFPRAYMEDEPFNFSFSGLKTAVVYYVKEKKKEFIQEHMEDICASFQEAVIDVLVEKCSWAMKKTNVKNLALGGGVACNSLLKERIKERGNDLGWNVFIPPKELCSDNGVMIATAGYFHLSRGERSGFELKAMSRMSLETLSN